jgi:hypothetical protein
MVDVTLSSCLPPWFDTKIPSIFVCIARLASSGSRMPFKIMNKPIGGLAKLAFAFSHQPAGAKQRVAEAEADAADRRERTEPAEFAADIAAVGDRKPLDQCTDHHAPDKCREGRGRPSEDSFLYCQRFNAPRTVEII